MSRRMQVQTCLLALGALATGESEAQDGADSLLDLSIEELANLSITSASGFEESWRTSAAAAFVLTGDAIRRSGVTSIPEALRLAPGVEVARRGAHSWSISIRGFNGNLSNKLLVLIDGRSVYSPLFAGVFWDVQDVPLEDIERIEVISGPGGTLWGANAVNGVINIITRLAAETQGLLVEAGGGDEDRIMAGVRFGGMIDEGISTRVYARFVERDDSKLMSREDSVDDFRMASAGFRLDWERGPRDRYTIQGDVYEGSEAGTFQDDFTLGTLPAGTFEDRSDVSGANVLARWQRQLDEDAELRVQAYVDHTARDIPNVYGESRDIYDVTFQHRFRIGNRNELLWGLGVRESGDRIDNSTFATFTPDKRSDTTFSIFFQDRIQLLQERLSLTLGSKFEDNDYTGSEVQPNARLAWQVDSRNMLWTAVSHAVRIPSRLDSDLNLTAPVSVPGLPFPLYVNVNGSDAFHTEELTAYEAGYRIQANEDLSFDLATFYNEYDDLQTMEPELPIVVLPPPSLYIILPNNLANGMRGESWGGTFVVQWKPLPSWRLRFQYAHLDMDLTNDPTSQDVSSANVAGNSPKHQLAVYSFADLPRNFSLFAGVRYVDDLPNLGIDDYTAVDLNFGWSPRSNFQMSLAVRNLTDNDHPEFSGGNLIERSAFFRTSWRF